jgi:hypothetical protein
MYTREIPPEQWQQFFDDFSRDHANWETSIELMGQDLGDQPEAEGVPLQGISFETVGSQKGDIEVAVGDTAESFQLHRIQKPLHVRIADTQPGLETDIEIETAEDLKAIVRVRPYPELPDLREQGLVH